MTKIYAVLTGDIIQSNKLTVEQLKSVQSRLEATTAMINDIWDDSVVGQVDLYRGDGWQLLLNRPEMALRISLFIRAALIGFENKADTRIAIGVATAVDIDTNQISRSHGQAFVLSGQALEAMKKKHHLAIQYAPDAVEQNKWMPQVVRLIDAVVNRWTIRQAETIFWAIQGLTQTEVAGKIQPPVSQPAAQKIVDAADLEVIEEILVESEHLA